NSGIGRATKKVRTRLNLTLDKDDSTVDSNGQQTQISRFTKASYKSKLAGDSSTLVHNVSMEEDFALLDGDMVTKVVDSVLLITFLNQGLAGGPWVIYGHYLSVRPWLSEFSMTQIKKIIQMMKLDVRTTSARRGSVNVCLGAEIPPPENGAGFASGFNVKRLVGHSKVGQRAKGKTIVIASGPKKGNRPLRLTNGNNNIQPISGQRSFDDGAIMGPKLDGEILDKLVFQFFNVSTKLDKGKHMVVHVMENPSLDSVKGK
ncbi:hypothetical protein Goari_004450, partial [Gossypium aridum]|nr:hypothetical protein [Gossypium aridum]